ncbi:MAG TPA: tetratricopeptide repeat protein [Gemmatimonadales bacterium]|nr:tetratricopeptide repeat protein [Gemmatimonadales bacterium]
MTDDIKTLTARVAEEPSSLAFLELGEALRRRGQLDAAYKVARGGLSRYPALGDAHDLLARVLSDQGDLAGAFDAWADALRFDPMRIGALKGLGFLYFRAGDVPAALDHLRRATEIDPDDISIRQAIERIRGATSQPASERARPDSPPVPAAPSGKNLPPAGSAVAAEVMADPGGNGGSQKGIMLVDGNGLRLNGTLLSPSNQDVGDGVAAELAGVSKEAARTSRLLGLGGWQAIAVESPEGNLYLVAPTPETMLLTVRDPSLPMARLGLIAERAAREAREWLVSER